MIVRRVLPLLAVGFLWQAAAQTTFPWDTSGNNKLQGNYFFRNVHYVTDTAGNFTAGQALYGIITFDGNGKYSISNTNTQLSDSKVSSGQPAPFPATNGTYQIGSHGFGFLDSPLFSNESVVGLVSNGVFVGSSTEGQVNDTFVAIAVGSGATVGTLKGKYWAAYMNTFTSTGNPNLVTDALFALNADGNGGLGAVSATGYAGNSSTAVTQNIPNATYSFSNGVGTMALGSSGSLLSGNKVFYVSQDGNFAVGGSANGYDMLFAVRAPTATVDNGVFKGLYYNVGMDENLNPGSFPCATSGVPCFDTYYGSLVTNGAGVILRDDRDAPFDSSAFEATYDTGYSLNPDGTYDRTSFKYAVGNGGLGFVGIGKGPTLGVVFGVKAPDFSGPGVFLNPTGIENSASYSPFTTGVTPGEFITLFGTNLAAGNATASVPFPDTLNNVQVLINNRKAPIYYVSPTQISVIVPYATETPNAQIQVNNNGTASNTVTLPVNVTAPGIFSMTQNGIGPGAVLHADFSLVSASNPAKPGEVLLIFLTGLGDVSPAVTDGTAAPSSPLSQTTNQAFVYIDFLSAKVSYQGLAPGFAGLYQVNAQVPTGVTAGTDVSLEIATTDADTVQTTIHIQ